MRFSHVLLRMLPSGFVRLLQSEIVADALLSQLRVVSPRRVANSGGAFGHFVGVRSRPLLVGAGPLVVPVVRPGRVPTLDQPASVPELPTGIRGLSGNSCNEILSHFLRLIRCFLRASFQSDALRCHPASSAMFVVCRVALCRQTGLTACTDCTPGKQAALSGSVSCTDCQVGIPPLSVLHSVPSRCPPLLVASSACHCRSVAACICCLDVPWRARCALMSTGRLLLAVGQPSLPALRRRPLRAAARIDDVQRVRRGVLRRPGRIRGVVRAFARCVCFAGARGLILARLGPAFPRICCCLRLQSRKPSSTFASV